ncbi:MAG TPA: cytochrome c biogenesis protein CcdA [Gemmatimonadales bacterium]|nr:cytochrome c biogenesis protein CcdA [Gemmatimonadales bacterium]
MSDAPSLGVLVAFAGGLLSFLSPCVLPLVPSYLGFITGFTFDEMADRRKLAMLHALLFVLGFTLVFMLFGASATALGRVLKYYEVWFQRVGGVLIILFGLYCLGVLKLRFLDQEARLHLDRKPVGYLGSVLVGMAFAAGWTPCIGPILGAILGLAASEASLPRGMLLLGSYSLGLAVPFLFAAFAVETFLSWFRRFRRHMRWVQRVSGVLLIAVGLLLATGQFTRLAGWLQGLTPAFLRSRL